MAITDIIGYGESFGKNVNTKIVTTSTFNYTRELGPSPKGGDTMSKFEKYYLILFVISIAISLFALFK